jgi:anti-sigma B factor antagonist
MLVEIISGRFRFHSPIPMHALQIDVSTIAQPRGRILHLHGPIVMGNLQAFRSELRKDYSALTLLDLSEVPFMDSTGLGEIVNFYSACRRSNGRLILVAPSPRVAELLHITRIETIIKITPSIQAALLLQ